MMSLIVEKLKLKMMSMMNMDCPDQSKCYEALADYLDGEGTEEQKKMAQLKLNNCVKCNNQFKLDKSIKQAIKKHFESKEAPQDLLDLIQEAMNKNP